MRLVFQEYAEKKTILPVAVWLKKDLEDESDVRAMLKENLREITRSFQS